MMNYRLFLLLFIQLMFGIFIGHFIIRETVSYKSDIVSISLPVKETKVIKEKEAIDNRFHLSPNVQMVNLSEPINDNFTCIKAKTLLNHISTHICLHEKSKDIYVSGAFQGANSIWEEGGVIRILQFLLRHPHLDFIDIGANIGTYTMYAAALGRFVLAIDCFAPNLRRIHRAVQLTNVANRVVLIQNAIFTHSGQSLRLSNDANNIGGQELVTSKNQTNNQSVLARLYIVKTIKFDDLEPILTARGIRGAIMKIDIEGSESFVVESGSQIFDKFEIPLIQIEWLKVRHHPDRVKLILDFFAKRNYDPMTLTCRLLIPAQHKTWPEDLFWLKRNVTDFC
jgi:FkbM family methyltransferase